MIRRELVIFLIVGATTVLFDFAIYSALVGYKVLEVDMAKAVGFLFGTVYAYFANCFWTFSGKIHHLRSVWRFAVLYSSTLGINVMVNALALKLLLNVTVAIQLAFLLATSVSACLNFLGMKFLVFKPIATPELQ